MRSYPLLVGGRDLEGRGWTYVAHASAFLRDRDATFNRKRQLELGETPAAADEELFAGRCSWGDDGENVAAIEAAAAAAREYGRFPLARRRKIFARMMDRIHTRAAELIEVLVAEGHPRRLAEWETAGITTGGDSRTVDWLMQQLHREFEDGERRIRLTRKPDGVVCVNPPQNAAASNSALGLFALLAGNALVVKAPRSCPLGVMFLYRDIVQPVLEEEGAPPGTLNVVSGKSQKINREWLRHDLVNDVLFFGESRVGLKLGADCIAAGKKPILELSGNDGLVVWRDACLEEAAEALMECFYGSGQICMVPKYSIVHPAVAGEFERLLLDRVADVRPGYPEDAATVLSPVLKADRFLELLHEATGRGARLLAGGRRVDIRGEPAFDGFFFEPTVVRVDGLEAADTLGCVREETFFPLLPLVIPKEAADDVLLEAVTDFMNRNPFGLRNSVWANDPAVLEAFAERVHNGGQIKFNESHIGFSPYVATHGGTGLTGGAFGELNYVALRTSHLQALCFGNGRVEETSRHFSARGTTGAWDGNGRPAAAAVAARRRG